MLKQIEGFSGSTSNLPKLENTTGLKVSSREGVSFNLYRLQMGRNQP